MSQKVAGSEGVKEQEPDQKKSKQDESENPQEFQNDTSFKQKSVNDLPTEMLMKVLKYGDDVNLMNFRLVNRQWRVISTEILFSRSGIELQFSYDETKKMFMQWIKKKMGTKSLADFLECFNESKNCFYTRFVFHFMVHPLPSKFGNEDWLKFLFFIQESIKCLKLVIEPQGVGSLEPFSEGLSDLLLNKIPQLEEFGLTFSSDHLHFSGQELFPPKKESMSIARTTSTTTTEGETIETTIFTTTTKPLPPAQLPQLKVLHLSEILFSKCPRIVEDLLKAAVNLKSIQDSGDNLETDDYVFLHKRGKLVLLEEAKMTVSGILFSEFKGNMSAFKLKKLHLSVSPYYKDENWAQASTFISDLFENNKNTLRELTIDPFGFRPDVKFPTFTKLERFTVADTKESEILEPVFPSGIHTLDVFPVVHTLELNVDWTTNFPGEENIPRIPSVTTLRVSDWKITENCIAKMILMCPNLKDFAILSTFDTEYYVDFMPIGRAIWTHMKKLESLDLQINVANNCNTFHSLDSCFTGISIENCKRLYEMRMAQKTLKRWKSQLSIPQSEFNTPARESASILDLKDLRNLSIKIEWFLGERMSKENLLERALTCVSKKYGFKRMKNLKYTIVQNVDY